MLQKYKHENTAVKFVSKGTVRFLNNIQTNRSIGKWIL